jgi:Ca2+-binding RTX toxin-like protein
LQGGNGNDVLNGGFGGDDTILGGNGNDTLIASFFNFFVSSVPNNNLLSGGAGNDTLTGDAGNDTLDGGDGSDTLISTSGQSLLVGGTGDDLLRMGSDDGVTDTINYTAGDGIDTVYEFVRGIGGDVLSFSQITNIDVVTVGTTTRLTVGDGTAGNNNFGNGQLLVTLEDTTGFTVADVGNNLVGSNFLFS